MNNSTPPLVISSDPRLIESVMSAAAGVGVAPEVARDTSVALRWWRSAHSVLIGIDAAAQIASLGLPSRTSVLLIGNDRSELTSWSVPLDASVLVLPEQHGLLASVLDPRRDEQAGLGRLLRLVGGGGGLGVSTLSVALTQVAVGQHVSAAVVELDPTAGLDLLLGAESAPGWRWSDLRAAAGHIEQLNGRLPNVTGVDVVSHARAPFARPRPRAAALTSVASRLRRGVLDDEQAPQGTSLESVRAVVASLTRSHRLVVADAGQGPLSVGDQWACTRTAMVVGASIRGLVAARSRLETLGLHETSVIIRVGPGRGIDPQVVADTLELPLLGVIPEDRGLHRGLDAGDPPGRARGAYRRSVADMLTRILQEDSADQAPVDQPATRPEFPAVLNRGSRSKRTSQNRGPQFERDSEFEGPVRASRSMGPASAPASRAGRHD